MKPPKKNHASLWPTKRSSKTAVLRRWPAHADNAKTLPRWTDETSSGAVGYVGTMELPSWRVFWHVVCLGPGRKWGFPKLEMPQRRPQILRLSISETDFPLESNYCGVPPVPGSPGILNSSVRPALTHIHLGKNLRIWGKPGRTIHFDD